MGDANLWKGIGYKLLILKTFSARFIQAVRHLDCILVPSLPGRTASFESFRAADQVAVAGFHSAEIC